MSDASTDVSTAECEVIYATSVGKDGVQRTDFIKLQELESGNAAGIVNAIDSAMTESIPKWKTKLTAVCFDGASVNFGQYNGVAARLSDDCPGIISQLTV